MVRLPADYIVRQIRITPCLNFGSPTRLKLITSVAEIIVPKVHIAIPDDPIELSPVRSQDNGLVSKLDGLFNLQIGSGMCSA